MSKIETNTPLPQLTGESTNKQKTKTSFSAVVGLVLGASLSFIGWIFLRVALLAANTVKTPVWILCLFCLLCGGYLVVRASQTIVGGFKQRKENDT